MYMNVYMNISSILGFFRFIIICVFKSGEDLAIMVYYPHASPFDFILVV